MKRIILFLALFLMGIGLILLHQGYASNRVAFQESDLEYNESIGIALRVMGSADIPVQEMALGTEEDLAQLTDLGCRFISRNDGSVRWEFPMRESVIYQRQNGKILMMTMIDTLGYAQMPLPPDWDNLEIVLANGMGTELESFPYGEMTPNAEGLISLNYHFSQETMGCCSEKERSDLESCCNGGDGCIDDNGPYAFWSCSNWRSGFYNSDCSYAWAYAGRCSRSGSYCGRSGYGSNCSPLIGHNPCWHWWWQGSGW